MKTISDYTIYCTEEQTKKALELGAPIRVEKVHDVLDEYSFTLAETTHNVIHNPTAEQMLGWLRSKGFRFKIVEHESDVYWQYVIDDYFDHNIKPSAKEATLAAIDAALECLVENKLLK
ncbi:MAG: hypothetical protein MJZ30_05825 [Paludibacteraceae bacterium]|nr:hypothetical protein [Paludibacteraceae bacterium]